MKGRNKHLFVITLIISFLSLKIHAQLGESALSKIADSLKQQLDSSKNDTSTINLLNAISREYRIIGNPEEALNYARQAHEKSIQTNFKKGESLALNNIGIAYMLTGKYEESLSYHYKALKLREELNDKTGMASTFTSIGAVYREQSDYARTLEFFYKSLKIRETIGDKKGAANSYTNIGIIYCYQRNFTKALEVQLKAFQLKQELGDKRGLADSYNCLGNIYEQQGSFDKAIENYLLGLKLRQETNDIQNLANSYMNIGNAYMGLGNLYLAKNLPTDYYYKKALFNHKKSLEILKKFNDTPNIAGAFVNIGNVYIKTNRLEEAGLYIHQALRSFNRIQNKEGKKECYQLLSELAEKQKDCDKALVYFKSFSSIKDSIVDEHSNRQIAEMDAKYESAKKDQNIALLTKDKALEHAEVSRQKLLRNGFIAGLIVALLLAFILYSRYNAKQKLNSALSNKNNELTQKNVLIEKQNEKIVDSINYAQLIQKSILREESEIQKLIPDSFIFLLPKDIVSGDFYWFSQINDNIIVAAVDCTGHGVPGAFMSMIGNTLLNQIVNEKKITTPSEILKQLHLGVYEALFKKNGGALSRDGMDIALCTIDYKNRRIEFAGAHNPLYLIVNNEIKIINADKRTIGSEAMGKAQNSESLEYTNHMLTIEPNTTLYLFTDGYMDQFGGPENKKFGNARFKELVLNCSKQNASIQKDTISASVLEWKGTRSQTDDILVIGLKL